MNTSKQNISLFLLFFFIAVNSQTAEKGLCFKQSIGAAYNPIGAIVSSGLHYRIPLVKKEGILWESTKLEIGITNEWTPTDEYLRIGITFVPIAFFELSAQAGPYVMYRHLGFGYCSFDSPDVPYDYDDLEDAPRQTETGYWISLAPTLKFKVTSIILVNAFKVNFFSIGDEGYFLERRTYSIHKHKDTDLIDDTFLFYKPNDKIMAGINYHFLKIFSTSYFSHRACGVFVFPPKLKAFDRFYAVLMAGAYMKDRVFKGKPYIALRTGFDLKVR